MTEPAHDSHLQRAHAVRCEQGPSAAQALGAHVDVAVVVDVLSFTTTLSVALERGVEVFPYRWDDTGAAAYAEERDAVLAVGRLEAAEGGAVGRGTSLSPAHLRATDGVPPRLVLPSPNGSSISFALAEAGCEVVGASLRNARAVAAWLAPRVLAGEGVLVVAAGERWPDDSLRPAVEDVWGAGAVLAALHEEGVTDLSPEAASALAAYRSVAMVLAPSLRGCASGRELVDRGFADDVEVAAELNGSPGVPLLVSDSFVSAPAG